MPTKGTVQSAGYDLSSAGTHSIPANGKGLVPTDLAISVPQNTYGRIAPRSGLALKSHISVGAGVIDADYRGNVGVVLFNHGQQPFDIKAGDKIAQLVLERYEDAKIQRVDT